jgi:hypothetical protein
MKIKIYNTLNSKNIILGKNTLRVNERGGLFSFSKITAETIGIVPKDRILFIQNEEKPEDFYIVKDNEKDGFEVRAKNVASGSSYSFNSCILATRLLDKGVDVKHVVKLNRSETFIIGEKIDIEGFSAYPVCRPKPIFPNKQ